MRAYCFESSANISNQVEHIFGAPKDASKQANSATSASILLLSEMVLLFVSKKNRNGTFEVAFGLPPWVPSPINNNKLEIANPIQFHATSIPNMVFKKGPLAQYKKHKSMFLNLLLKLFVNLPINYLLQNTKNNWAVKWICISATEQINARWVSTIGQASSLDIMERW